MKALWAQEETSPQGQITENPVFIFSTGRQWDSRQQRLISHAAASDSKRKLIVGKPFQPHRRRRCGVPKKKECEEAKSEASRRFYGSQECGNGVNEAARAANISAWNVQFFKFVLCHITSCSDAKKIILKNLFSSRMLLGCVFLLHCLFLWKRCSSFINWRKNLWFIEWFFVTLFTGGFICVFFCIFFPERRKHYQYLWRTSH